MSALYAVTAMSAAGCGGTSPCTTLSPATIGIPTSTMFVPVRFATVKAMGTSSTNPTSKNTGMPTMNAMTAIAQWTRRSPNAAITVCAIRSAPPDSAIILPSIVPSATTSAMWPSVFPTPVSNALTMPPIGMPTLTPSASETTTSVTNGLSLYRAIRTTSATIATAAWTRSCGPWTMWTCRPEGAERRSDGAKSADPTPSPIDARPSPAHEPELSPTSPSRERHSRAWRTRAAPSAACRGRDRRSRAAPSHA